MDIVGPFSKCFCFLGHFLIIIIILFVLEEICFKGVLRERQNVLKKR